jgi:transposase
MGRPYPMDIREHAVALVEQGHSPAAAARWLGVSVRFVNDMVRLKRETGSVAPRRQGNPGRGKLTDLAGWVRDRRAARPDLTIDALAAEIETLHGITVHRSSVARLLHRHGLAARNRGVDGGAAARRSRTSAHGSD